MKSFEYMGVLSVPFTREDQSHNILNEVFVFELGDFFKTHERSRLLSYLMSHTISQKKE